MKLYLDNSVLNRPYDDQRQPRILLETLAFSVVLQIIETGEATMLRSPMHDLENQQSPFPARRQWVEKCLALASHTTAWNEEIRKRANDLQASGIKPRDALHLAAAETGRADYFLTCDDRLIRKYPGPIPVLNPADFILLWSETKP
jgi:hypothetical protein